jgi:hypothetical protein
MMRGETNPAGGHPRELWAERVVGDLLRRDPSRYVRRGFLAQIMYFASAAVPVWVIDWAFAKTCRFAELRKALNEEAQDTKDDAVEGAYNEDKKLK